MCLTLVDVLLPPCPTTQSERCVGIDLTPLRTAKVISGSIKIIRYLMKIKLIQNSDI